jgi:hypothetical protein
MKDVMVRLLMRNGIILAIFAVGMVLFSVIPQLGAAAFWLMLFLLLGLVWANGILVNHMSRLLAALLTAVITLVVGGGVLLLTTQIQKLFGR